MNIMANFIRMSFMGSELNNYQMVKSILESLRMAKGMVSVFVKLIKIISIGDNGNKKFFMV